MERAPDDAAAEGRHDEVASSDWGPRGEAVGGAEPGAEHLQTASPQQAELLDTGSLRRGIEALLFVAAEPLPIKRLAKLTGADEAAVTTALAQIDTEYAERGIVLREVGGGYRFATAPAARAVVEAYLLPPKTTLSPAALETLAIVAYNEPVTKAQVEEIRGVSADSVIATLLDRRFIVESGRKESPGRPLLYRTTPEFLEAFGLNSLGDLPQIEDEALTARDVELPMTQARTTPEPPPDETPAEATEDQEEGRLSLA